MTNTIQAALAPPTLQSHPQAVKIEEPKNRFQYLYFDLSKCVFGKVQTTKCDCAAITAKVFILALPILLLLEGLLDLAAFPFIWIANQLCPEKLSTKPAPSNQPPPQNPLPPNLPLPTVTTQATSQADGNGIPPIPLLSQEEDDDTLPLEVEEAVPNEERPPTSSSYFGPLIKSQPAQFAWKKWMEICKWAQATFAPAEPNPPEE
jgi:hypothetical protein